MRRRSLLVQLGGALLGAVVLLGSSPQAAQPAKLKQLRGISELTSWFNANTAHVKAIILLSPT
jgi:hypothetical protein